ncbi:MAG: hypothetical protein JNL43_12315 [Flavobacteriales bacterium]|nr:hypothetical protein [Flavobacteriales bacterium]
MILRSSKTVLITAILLVTGCTQAGHTDIPIDEVQLHVEIGRLDRDLFRGSPDSMQAVSRKAYADYGEFYRIYIEDILQGAPLEDPRLTLVLGRFVNDPDWSSTQHAVDSVLGDLEPQRLQFEEAFRRLKVLFPDSLVPRVITFNSGFNYGIYPTDSVLGVGTEWFIGKDHPVIGYLAPDAFPQYVKDRMRPEMLVPSAIKGWLLVHYTRDIAGADVLTNLVEAGKVLALLDALLPDVPPAQKFAFSEEQYAWCEANEYNVWKEIVAKDQLFSKSAEDIGRLMNDGPFTNGYPRESPGHIGEWIGYRMVTAYMKDDPKITFEQLFALDDPREILQHYKPR